MIANSTWSCISSMCITPPSGNLLFMAISTFAASDSTSLCILVDAAALLPSTLKKALVIATTILSKSKDVTFPFLRMTLYLPGIGGRLTLSVIICFSALFERLLFCNSSVIFCFYPVDED